MAHLVHIGQFQLQASASAWPVKSVALPKCFAQHFSQNVCSHDGLRQAKRGDRLGACSQ